MTGQWSLFGRGVLTLAVWLGAMNLAACERVIPASSVQAPGVSVSFNVVVREASRRLLDIGYLPSGPTPYTVEDLNHIRFKLFEVPQPSQPEVEQSTKSVPWSDLRGRITFTGLKAYTQYRVRAWAYRFPAENDASLISQPQDAAALTFTTANDDAPVITEPFQVVLKPRPGLVALMLNEQDTNLGPARGIVARQFGTGNAGVRLLTAQQEGALGKIRVSGPGLNPQTLAQTPLSNPRGLALRDDGSAVWLYGCNSNQVFRVKVHDPLNGLDLLTTFTNTASPAPALLVPATVNLTGVALGSLSDLTFDQAGNLYLTDSVYHRVVKVPASMLAPTPTGSPLIWGAGSGHLDGATPTFTSPSGITVGPDGLLYVCEGDGYIRVIDPATGFTRTLLADNTASEVLEQQLVPWSDPRDLIFDAAGNLYVLDATSGLYRFNRSGRFDRVRARDAQVAHYQDVPLRGEALAIGPGGEIVVGVDSLMPVPVPTGTPASIYPVHLLDWSGSMR